MEQVKEKTNNLYVTLDYQDVTHCAFLYELDNQKINGILHKIRALFYILISILCYDKQTLLVEIYYKGNSKSCLRLS